MEAKHKDICDVVFKMRDHRDPQIRKTIIFMLPSLAVYNPQSFSIDYLPESMSFLMHALKNKDKEKSLALISVGEIAVAVEKDIAPFLDEILSVVKENLLLSKGCFIFIFGLNRTNTLIEKPK